MAKQSLNDVVQNLRKIAAVHTSRALSDRELLDRFVAARDDAAFSVLIERHGPMVLGVCGRALPNCHDAEDACQATFLVLACKAASIRKKGSLSSWLHGVAARVAANLKRDRVRRTARERATATPAPRDPAAEVSWREVQAILDQELQRLPERYRAPLILCYLECLTRDEAARQLGLSPTTLHGRLDRARNLLRGGLCKRGLTLGAVLSAAALSDSAGRAAMAPLFVVSSAKAALLLATGQPLTEGVVATRVLALTREVLKSMFLTKLNWTTATVLCAGLCVALLGVSFTSLSSAQDAKPRPGVVTTGSFSTEPESDTDFIRRISKDLRGSDPTPTEIHFFVTSKDTNRRQKLIDLFIQERQAKNPQWRPNLRESLLDAGKVNLVWLDRNTGEKLAPLVLDSAKVVEIRSLASGYVVKIACKAGSEVKKGDVLVQIDRRPYEAELGMAEISMQQKQANLAHAEANYKLHGDLARKQANAVNLVELALYRAQEQLGKAELRLAETKRDLAKLHLDATTVRAPIDGKIGQVLVSAGNLVTAGKTAVVTLLPLENAAK
jgi:RNA polymerase sigma factor (sigma-70 family)